MAEVPPSYQELQSRLEASERELERLRHELQERSREVAEALERQQATSAVLQTISRSTFDLDAVLSTLLSDAARILRAPFGGMYRLKPGGGLVSVANLQVGEVLEWANDPETMARFYPGLRARKTRMFRVPAAQVLADELSPWGLREFTRTYGDTVSALVPLRRDDDAIGVLVLSRTGLDDFTPAEIALVETFADQAVIAIENARLFNELHARTEELATSADVLRIVSDYSADLDAVLQAVLAQAAQLVNADGGMIVAQNTALPARGHGTTCQFAVKTLTGPSIATLP
jgi:GAF domain-containing protein